MDKQPHFYDHLHSHPELQLTLIVASEGVCSIAHQMRNFAVGDMYLIGSDVPHVFRNGAGWYDGSAGEEAHSISLFFRRNSFGEGLFELPEFFAISQLLDGAQRGIQLGNELAESLTADMLAMPELSGATRIIRLLSLLERIAANGHWKHISPQAGHRKPKHADYQRLNDILRFILENYQSPIGLEEVAAVAHLSPSAFCRFFKKRTRKSFVSYLNEFRASMACKLLVEGEMPVAEICFQTGFSNLANFNRQFRRVTGTTPTAYRKANWMVVEAAV